MSTTLITSGADGSAHGDARRDVILKQARQVFLAQGFGAAHMEQISRFSRVSTATLYSFFPSKDSLFSAVIEDAAKDFNCDRNLIEPPPGPVRDRLDAFAHGYARFIGDSFVHEVFRLVLAEQPRFSETVTRVFGQDRSDVGAGLVKIIEIGNEQRELACANPKRATGQLLGMIEHPLFLAPLFTGGAQARARSASEVAAEAVETFMARYGL